MDLAAQLTKIRAQKPIDPIDVADRYRVLAHSVFLFRKFVSPISDGASLERNLSKIALLCRLENDAAAEAMVLAARAVAQIDSTVRPGEYDDLARACGLDVIESSTNVFGAATERGVIFGDIAKGVKGGFRLTYRDIPIVLLGASQEGSHNTGDFADACRIIDGLSVRTSGGSQNIELAYGPAEQAQDIEIFDTVHDPWRPSTVFSPRLTRHPTSIIEPATLAATPYPKATYQPRLPTVAIERGFISDAQYETVVYALQAVTEFLPGSPKGLCGPAMKGGFIIGDGTGVGKTNEFCAVIMDQWLRGKRRHVIVVERSKHVDHIMDAWNMIGGDASKIMFQGTRSAREPLPSRDGVIVTTYALIRDDRRYQSLLDWANEDDVFEGIVVFDEAHNMRNAVEDKHDEGAGRRNQSQQGMRGVELQDALPRGGVIYASATMATDVYNLGYAPRLGLWGENAPFDSQAHFTDEMMNLDEAALEQICIDLKAAGRYCSRTLSFDGVEYDEIEYYLTPKQRVTFDTTVNAYKKYNKLTKEAWALCTGNDKRVRSRGFNSEASYQRETIEQLMTNFNVDPLITQIHEDLANGYSPVVQIAKTGEARLVRSLKGRTQLTCEEYRDNRFKDRIFEEFPVHKMTKDEDADEWVPVLDANGNPIEIASAIVLRDQALELADEMKTELDVLDRLYLEFGADQVAEMTGRSVRLLPKIRAGVHEGWIAEDRSAGAASADVAAFQEGRKSILVFSLGAGGTGLSYHAAKDVRNKNRRTHYLLELGRRAESAVQGIGRTHRSGQVIPPIVKLIRNDIPAQEIFASRTLAKIAKLGALSRGHQHATSNAIFEQRIPLHSRYATEGWKMFIAALQMGEIEGMEYSDLCADMDSHEIDKFDVALKRLATLTTGLQKQVMNELRERTEEAIARAIRSGSYNQGLETIRGKSIELVDENLIENVNGSMTRYYRLRRHEQIDKTPFSQAASMYARASTKKSMRAVFMRHKVNGRIALGITQSADSRFVDLTTPGGSKTRTIEAIRSEPWKVMGDLAEAERYWNLEVEGLDLQEYSEIHMLSGSLLYNWDKMPEGAIGLNRCKTDDGKIIVGRVISKNDIRGTLQALGMQSNFKPTQIARMLSKVDLGASISFDNGWSVDLPQGANDYRLNVPFEEQTGSTRGMLTKLGVVSINTPLGMEFEIPKGDAIEAIQKLAIGSDLSLEGVAANSQPIQKAA